MSKNRLYWLLQIGGWILYMFINTALILIADRFDVKDFINQIIVTVFVIFTTHVYRNFLLKRGWLKYRMPKLIPRILTMVVFLAFIDTVFLVFISFIVKDTVLNTNLLLKLLIGNLAVFIVLHLIWNLIYFAYHYFENYRASLKFEAAINEIKLNKLKSQLNPHFIFNALNSIRALVDENPKKSKLAITQLSGILRNALSMDDRKLIKFSEELEIVKDYLGLESVRYEERLRIEFDIDPDSEGFQIPPLMVQTLVENGIKHGVSKLVNGGLIKVTTQVNHESLNIEIRNSGQYLNGIVMKHKGYGIDNTKKRLELLYGDKFSFSIKNEDENTVLTALIIPKYREQ